MARDVLTLVAAECRSRLEIHHMALERIEQQHTEAAAQAAPKVRAASAANTRPSPAARSRPELPRALPATQMPGVNWVHDLPATDIEPAMGVRVRIAAWKRMVRALALCGRRAARGIAGMRARLPLRGTSRIPTLTAAAALAACQMSVIKRELVAVAAGDVIAALQLGMCSRAELNPVVLCYSPDGQPLNESLDVSPVAWVSRRRAAVLHSRKARIAPRKPSVCGPSLCVLTSALPSACACHAGGKDPPRT